MSAHAHGHAQHHHRHGGALEGGDWRYAAAIGLNLVFVAAEAGLGLWSNSTALLADAGHNLSDVLGLALAGGAAWLARRRGTARRTYGFGKATILAALANAVLLVFACGAIALEAGQRLLAPSGVDARVVIAVAAVGFVLNLAAAMLFFRGREADVNQRGAFLHMAADAGVSLGVAAAGAAILMTGRTWIDPLVSLGVVAVILIGTWGLLRESMDLAMDTAPAGLDIGAVQRFLNGLPGVTEVHDLHVWNTSATETALTAHLVREAGAEAGFLSDALSDIRARFGIRHATLQVEGAALDHCPDC